MVLPQPTCFVSIAVPRTALTALAPAAEDMIVRPLPPRGGALALLLRYLDVLDDASILESPALGHAVAAHLCDLCAVAVGASRDGTEYAQHRGVRAARLRALKDDIAAHLADPSLSPGEIAQRQRMTPRYVHKLFELEGITLSRYVLGLRLLQVHRALTDPLRAGTTISGLAYAAGFGDLSTFNREFRRRFGTTPSDVRASSPRRRHTMAYGR
jgi:AraC-like DNA-binding protein